MNAGRICRGIMRLLLFLMLTAGVVWVGSRFSSLVQPVHADVYQVFEGADRFIPDYQKGGVYGDTGTTYINNQEFSYAVEVVHASVHDIMKYYETLYRPAAIRFLTDEEMRHIGMKPGGPAHKVLRWFELWMAQVVSPMFVKEEPSYGFLGVLDTGDNEKWFIRKRKRWLDGVVGKAVIALKEKPDSPTTTVIRYWSEGDLNLSLMFPKDGMDAPGFDLENVDRHPYSQRLVSVGQKDKLGESATVVYRLSDTPEAALRYYAIDLAANEWSLSDAARKGGVRAGHQDFLYAVKGERELYVFFDPDDRGGVLAMFLERRQY